MKIILLLAAAVLMDFVAFPVAARDRVDDRESLVGRRVVYGLVLQTRGRAMGRLDMVTLESDTRKALADYLNSQMRMAGFPGDVDIDVEQVSSDTSGRAKITYRQLINGIPVEYSPTITVEENGVVIESGAVIFAPSLAESFAVTPEEARFLAKQEFAAKVGVPVQAVEWSGVKAGDSVMTAQGNVSRHYAFLSGVEDVGVRARPKYVVDFYAAKPSSAAGTYSAEIDGVTGEVTFRKNYLNF